MMNSKFKKTALILFVALTFFNFPFASAQESPERFSNEDWSTAETRALSSTNAEDRTFATGPSARRLAQLYRPDIDVSHLPEWNGSMSDLQMAFDLARDDRPYIQSSRPDFPRRSTWLYPTDGCYARAAHIARTLQTHQLQRPGKIFAFGNLRVKTKYEKNGYAYWWYHVAAAYRIGHRAVILDPGVDFYRPLWLEDWMARISSRPERIKIAFCDSHSYTPSQICRGAQERQERSSLRHQNWLLGKEWNRLVALRLNPERLLGEFPPWMLNPFWNSVQDP